MPKQKQEPDYEQRKRALTLEQARDTAVSEVVARLPQRNTAEVRCLRKLVTQLHETLKVYDLMPAPPAVAGLADSWFATALSRLNDIADASNEG